MKYEIKEQIPFKTSYDFEVKSLSDDKAKPTTIKGYASTFGNEDLSGHMMMKGCFDNCLSETKGLWPVKMEHEDTIGINKEAKVDKKGLFIVSDIFSHEDDLPRAKEAVAIIKNCMKYGHKLGLSVGGIITKSTFIATKDSYYIEIKGFDVLEHSVVGTPANPKAGVTSNKAFMQKLEENNALHNKKNFLFDLLKSCDRDIEILQSLLI